GGFRKDRSHHPGAGCASARPSSAEEGSQNVQSPGTRKASVLLLVKLSRRVRRILAHRTIRSRCA
ncbi:MAG: hypothetical protein L0387_15225, partial [Acidobacteria bacterium]|nr:hypothetical protein [Acidobacteriota bacterium]